jgi:hypothetical protein
MRRSIDHLNARAEEVHEIAKRIEHLTKDTTIRYGTLGVSVEARAAFEQAKELR